MNGIFVKFFAVAVFCNLRNVKSSDNNSSSTEETINNASTTEKHGDQQRIEEALREIAYYLRTHKFNDFDRRYETNPTTALREHFRAFPRPPLRSLHWEVHKFCEPTFISCVEYLYRKVRNTGLRRNDDTSVIMQEQKWKNHEHSQQINATETECRNMMKSDNTLANPFEGPIERFQWRVTASYYMCWYTMNKVHYLKHLKENCDNFASCLDPRFGPNNNDPRANDALEFNCALYSFCPDPCCQEKHVTNLDECWNKVENPCFQHNPPQQRNCLLNFTENTDFRELILNHWNVTCRCPQKGYEWSSRYGLCTDIDECASGVLHCNVDQEACVNLPGQFQCTCKWGYTWHPQKQTCIASPALSIIKLRRSSKKEEKKSKKATSLVKRLFSFFRSSSSSPEFCYGKYYLFVMAIAVLILIILI